MKRLAILLALLPALALGGEGPVLSTVSVSGTSARTSADLGSGWKAVRCTVEVFFRVGNSSAVAITTDMPIPSGMIRQLYIAGTAEQRIAFITSGGSGTCSIYNLTVAPDGTPPAVATVDGSAISPSSVVATGNITTSSTSTPTLGCTGAATCNFESAVGQTADFDCGGGTCTARLGAAATTSEVGKVGGTTTIKGSASFTGTIGATSTTVRGSVATDGAGNGSATVSAGAFCVCSGKNNPVNVCSLSGTTLTVQASAASDPVQYICML